MVCYAQILTDSSQSKHFKSKVAVHIVHTVHKGTRKENIDDDIAAPANHLQYWCKSSIITLDKGNMAVISFPRVHFISSRSLLKLSRPLGWEEMMCSYANTDKKQETFLHMCKISSNREAWTCLNEGIFRRGRRWRHMLYWHCITSKGRMENMRSQYQKCFTSSPCYKPTFQNSTFYSSLASPILPQKRSQCDFAESEGQTGALLRAW